ncbi:MAG: NADP-dependent oxidoreductase [Hyphomicrobiales bacterium]|nr:NADP-dependent oxidoreductase [Hyphomicrobiales bacterium]
MKAVFINEHGGPEVLDYGDLPDPSPKAGEVLVDVVAASINGADWKVRSGESHRQSQFPYVLGRDFSGTVGAIGTGVTDLRVGDPVFGVLELGRDGAQAEKVAIKSELVTRKPEGISHIEAAALALTGLTALSAIEETLKLQRGERILIQGGAGGVAGFAVQLAKHIGAHVITTASAANHDYLRTLGADEIVDYNSTDFTKTVTNCDAVFDTVGGDVALRSFAVLKPGGRAAFIASGITAPKPDRSDVTSLRPPVGRHRRHLDRIVALVQAGAVRVPEIKVFPLAEARAAQAISEGRHFRGKLVLEARKT